MSTAENRPRLTSEAKAAIRKEFMRNDAWNSAFRNKHGFSFSSMTVDDYFRAAELLNISVPNVLEAAGIEYRTHNNRTARAADAFCDSAPRAPKASSKMATEAAGVVDVSERTISTSIEKLARLMAELTVTTVDANQVRDIVTAEIEKLDLKNSGTGRVVRIEVTENALPVSKLKGHFHPSFDKLLRACTARGVNGFAPNVWLAGPAGSGKTYAAMSVAKALDIPFHFNGALAMPHELLGFVDAGGTYHRTPFREAYENGGVFLFDEVDGSDNAALLALNAALANGLSAFPDKTVKRHKDCIIIAAANTWGHGATAEYVGRSKIDAAFLSRFPVRIGWNYDEELERNISGNSEFAARVQDARRKAAEKGLKILITPRHSEAGAALIAAGFTFKEAEEMTFLADLSRDQRLMIA